MQTHTDNTPATCSNNDYVVAGRIPSGQTKTPNQAIIQSNFIHHRHTPLIIYKMNIDLVCHFWRTRFNISAEHQEIQRCITEETVLAMLKDDYPQLEAEGERLRNTFLQFSLNAGIGLRHFKGRQNTYHFNAQRINPAHQSDSHTALALINTQGLITQTRNKSKFLHDFL